MANEKAIMRTLTRRSSLKRLSVPSNFLRLNLFSTLLFIYRPRPLYRVFLFSLTKSTISGHNNMAGTSVALDSAAEDKEPAEPTKFPDGSTPGIYNPPSGMSKEDWERHVKRVLKTSETTTSRLREAFERIVR